jgi:hypothetical protein
LAPVRAISIHADGLGGQIGQRLHHGISEPVAFGLGRLAAATLGRVAAAVGDRHHHRDQRDAVTDAVVHAGDQCAAAFVVVDQVKLPERVVGIERRVGEFADQRLQRGALALAGLANQRVLNEVALNVEGFVFEPGRTHRIEHDALPEALVLEQLALDALAQRLARDGGLQQPDADDHHQVDVVVHPQPGGVYTRHALRVRRHRFSLESFFWAYSRCWVTCAASMPTFTHRSASHGRSQVAIRASRQRL